MSRWISLIVLLAVIGVTAVVLYRVMANFLLPLFLAAVLTVIFRPVHEWMLKRCADRPTTAATFTTLAILLTVLVPLGGISVLAIREAFGVMGGGVLDRAGTRLAGFRQQLGLEMPFQQLPSDPSAVNFLVDLDQMMRELPDELPEAVPANPAVIEAFDGLRREVDVLRSWLEDLSKQAEQSPPQDADSVELKHVRTLRRLGGEDAFLGLDEIVTTLDGVGGYLRTGRIPDVGAWVNRDAISQDGVSRETGGNGETAGNAGDAVGQGVQAAQERESDADEPGLLGLGHDTPMTAMRKRMARLKPTYEAFRIDLLGGPVWAWATDLANPGSMQIDALRTSVQRYLRSWLPSVAGQATALMGHLVFGLGIITLSLFYFLKDGPAMVRTLMRLSPLDDRYEAQLLSEFDTVSRAVVLATLLSSLAQALLAGVAYFFAGFDSVFLLTCLTLVLAMVPFVGAAAVWFPACLWLAFVEERWVAAIVVFIYGAAVVSMVDNFIKPFVLHGHSKLHPLLALLSVLGGVELRADRHSRGTDGCVVFAVLLNILHSELQSLDRRERELEKSA